MVRIVAAVALLLATTPAKRSTPARHAGVPGDSQAFLEAHTKPVKPLTAAQTRRVDELLKQMTLKEKVGQMTQLDIGMVTAGKRADLKIDADKLRKAVVEYGVGSILNVNDEAMTVAQWHEVIRAIQAAAAETRLKVPVVYGVDTIHGANYVKGATLFPQPLGMAATWNPELMLEGSRIAAAETRAAGVPWNFSPVLDVGRQPLWSRLYETFGEDTHLATVMGVASVRGYQGDDPAAPTRVGACLKHYVGYSVPLTGHDRTPALIPEPHLRDVFLPPFAAAVRAGALSVMVNSGELNGVPGHVNDTLLKDVLRGELGFDGVVVSDWEDVKKLVEMHRTHADEKEATRAVVMAGVDMSMVPSDYSFSDLLLALVQERAVPMARIDEAVRRILVMKMRLGLFDDPLAGTQAGTAVGSAESHAVALRAAQESIVLLKNEGGVLPLSGQKVLVTGPTADSLPSLNNGWTVNWQGDRIESYPTDRLTVVAALRAKLGADPVRHVQGVQLDKEIDVDAAVAAARDVDVVIVCLGEGAYAETPGNIDDLMLSEPQLKLARAIAATGKPMVLLLVEGRPRVVRGLADAARAVVLALNPGMEGGQAIADVLTGVVNPSGRMPITYPRLPHALRTYDHRTTEMRGTDFQMTAVKPLFEFGSGLSYTTFGYSGLTVTPSSIPGGGVVDVSVRVRNTGGRAGAEVVQLYLTDKVASLTPPVKRLKRFAKVPLEPGEEREVRFRLDREDMSFVNAANTVVLEPGDFEVRVGTLRQGFTVRR